MSTDMPKHYLFVDSCVIQASGDKNKSKSETVSELFSSLNQEGFNLAISEITVFETLQGLWGQQAKKVATRLKGFEWKVISNHVLTLAAILQGLYVQEQRKDVDVGDKILAATAILENGVILTENHKDFPPPFFTTKRSIPLKYLIDGRTNKTIDLALYEPNNELISRRVNENDK